LRKPSGGDAESRRSQRERHERSAIHLRLLVSPTAPVG
jgi:hypothetical protein